MRNHDLFNGEVVFDLGKQLFGVIVEISANKAVIDMNGETKNNYPYRGWCEYENRAMFDCEITEDDLVWETDVLDDLYQVAWGTTDLRTGNIVCYEHNDIGEGYPYYSPYLDENLYTFEVDER